MNAFPSFQKVRIMILAAVLAVPALDARAATDAQTATSAGEAFFHPREVASGMFEKWKEEAAKNPMAPVTYTFTRVE
jgi:hypothetical protein